LWLEQVKAGKNPGLQKGDTLRGETWGNVLPVNLGSKKNRPGMGERLTGFGNFKKKAGG